MINGRPNRPHIEPLKLLNPRIENENEDEDEDESSPNRGHDGPELASLVRPVVYCVETCRTKHLARPPKITWNAFTS
jgi:hypothetical protein